jgi:RNA polymerase sigma-70 factor (ECF subfamily)
MQSSARHASSSIDDANTLLAQRLQADEWFDGDEVQTKLQLAIAQLPDKQKQVFNLRYYEEMPYEEMSQLLNTSVGALKASFHHAVKKIESAFSEAD